MVDGNEIELSVRAKRVVKAPAIRRAELIDCAQTLFLEKGYERTTINDVIDRAALSKGAFYHHFRAKEDLLEAIAARFAQQALGRADEVRADGALDPLGRLNRLLAMTREWKAGHLPQLRAMFTTLLLPENATLYHRIVGAVFEAMAPMLTAVIEDGRARGAFDVADPGVAAEAMLWLGEGRRLIVVRALEMAEAGDVDGAVRALMKRLRAEGEMIDRILGLAPGSVDLAGPEDYLKTTLQAWNDAPEGAA